MLSQDDLKDFMLKEIDLVQDVIKRMAYNSFLIKGWTITLVVGVLILKGSKVQAIVSFIPIFAMWYLDAYFLRQERLFRQLYEWIIANRLSSEENIFSMDTCRFSGAVDSIPRIMMSLTLKWFYLSIAIVALLCVIILLSSSSAPTVQAPSLG